MSRTRARARKVAAAGSKSSKAVPKAAGPSSAPSIDDLVGVSVIPVVHHLIHTSWDVEDER